MAEITELQLEGDVGAGRVPEALLGQRPCQASVVFA